MLLGETANAWRHVKRLEVRDVLRDHPQGDRDVAPLPERVDAEARQILVLIRDVEIADLLEGREPLR